MEQTSDWVRLREILESSSAFVRDTVCSLLNYEMARSFQNVAGQLQVFQDIVADVQSKMGSKDAAALRHLMLDIHPSNIRALQREAAGIQEDTTKLRSALHRGDFQTLGSRADRIAKKAERFRDKYAELRPKLDKLKIGLEEIAAKCAAGEKKSESLIAETEQRIEWWWWKILAGILGCGLTISAAATGAGIFFLIELFMKQAALGSATAALSHAQAAAVSGALGSSGIASGVAGGVASFGGLGAPAATFLGSELLGGLGVSMGLMATPAAPLGVVAGIGSAAGALNGALTYATTSSAVTAAQASVVSLQAGIAALSTSLTAFVVPFLCGGLALALLGYAGRDLVKKLLGQLWAAEIEEHKRTKAAFQHMKHVVQEAAEKLGSVCEKNDALEQYLDLVVEAAEELTATAEEATQAMPGEMEELGAKLHHQVGKLCSECAQVPQAFEELFSSLQDLEPSLQQVGPIPLNPAVDFCAHEEARLALSYASHDPDPTQGQSVDIEVDLSSPADEILDFNSLD
eukprot:Skav204995  [mRNA]  locus=scaffold4368:44574:46127:+ [translate_table: standard]